MKWEIHEIGNPGYCHTGLSLVDQIKAHETPDSAHRYA